MNFARSASLWAPVVAFMSLVWFVSGQGNPQVPVVVWDKLLHAAAYAVLGALTFRACHGGLWRPWRWAPTLVALTVALGYGAIDEWHQSRVPGRDPSVADWIADAFGVGGAWLALRVAGLLQRRPEPAPAERRS